MEHWESFLYLYGVGGILFFTAIYLGLSKNVINMQNKTDRKLIIGFLIAYFMYVIIHAVWNLAAIGAMK